MRYKIVITDKGNLTTHISVGVGNSEGEKGVKFRTINFLGKRGT